MFSLEAEERCGHLVTVEVKKLWKTQLGLLAELKRICEKYDIKYYAVAGTLLGAVRHKGYIPWDDDIDVAMFPEDYEKFCEVAKSELPEYYCFQNFRTHDGVGAALSRIRDSRTTFFTDFEYETFSDREDYNFGIFLDVFCLWEPPTKMQLLRAFLPKLAQTGYTETIKRRKKLPVGTSAKARILSFISAFYWRLISPFTTRRARIEKIYKIMSVPHGEREVGLCGTFPKLKRFMWDREDFLETVELPYEDTTITCPKNYDNMLRKTYGDYMEFVKGGAVHTTSLFDADTPYKDKLSKMREIKKTEE